MVQFRDLKWKSTYVSIKLNRLNKRMRKNVFLYLTIIVCSSCVTFAPPSPLLTYGGPKTTEKGLSEAAIGVGTGAALFDGAHAGAQGWLARYRYGIAEKTDFGADFSGASRNDGQYFALKLASRHQLTEKTRLELGFGAADDSDGKSLNWDVAYTIGTVKDKPWNYYTSLRLAYAKGYPGNAVRLPGQSAQSSDSIPPPNTFFALVNLGAQGEISPNQKIIFEGAYGYIFPENESKGPAFLISAGLLFTIGRKVDN